MNDSGVPPANAQPSGQIKTIDQTSILMETLSLAAGRGSDRRRGIWEQHCWESCALSERRLPAPMSLRERLRELKRQCESAKSMGSEPPRVGRERLRASAGIPKHRAVSHSGRAQRGGESTKECELRSRDVLRVWGRGGPSCTLDSQRLMLTNLRATRSAVRRGTMGRGGAAAGES